MADCKCKLSASKNELYDQLVREKVVEVLSYVNEDYEEKATLKCLLCSKKWEFTRNDSYHYPIISWRKI